MGRFTDIDVKGIRTGTISEGYALEPLLFAKPFVFNTLR